MCLTDDDVLELVCGSHPQHAALLAHLDTCDDCRELVAAAAPEGDADGWEQLAIGATLGRYRIVDIVGAGAMGFVFAAEDPELGRNVALKLLRAGGTLAKEAQALARLQHPNVVAVHDVGVFGAYAFVAMELVDGGTLRDWLRTPRPWREIADAFRQAGEGLAAAHAAGLVHRDVKPENILVGKDGRVRVTDFGLAIEANAAVDTVAGTPRYLAPELRAGAAADARSDQFALCVGMHEALDDAPRWLRRVVGRGLADDPDARWPSVRALVDAVARGPRVTPMRVAGIGIAIAAGAVLIARHGDRCAAAPVTFRAPTGAVGLDAAFARYEADWNLAKHAACVADEPARDACLASREAYARELARQLAVPGVRQDGALDAAASMPSVEACARPVGGQSDPELEAKMARAAIAGDLADHGDPATFAALADEARAAKQPALEARALYLKARYAGDEAIEATALEQSALAALAAHDDAALADAWTRLAFHAGFHAGDQAASAQWAAYARAAIDRLGGDPLRDAELELARGFSFEVAGRGDEARTAMQHARALFVQARGPDYWRIGTALYGEGAAVISTGKVAEALPLYEQARAFSARLAGKGSTTYVTATDNEAVALIELGRIDEGLALFTELERTTDTSSWRQVQMGGALREQKKFADALAHDQRAAELSAKEHQTGVRATYAALSIARDLLGLGRTAEALPYLEQVLAARANATADERAEIQFELAGALGKRDPRARALATEARANLATLLPKYGAAVQKGLDEIDAWLK